MGAAFSSSLFGLAASLYFGWVELQTARAQNGFVEDFETWLASLVQAGGGIHAAPQASTQTAGQSMAGAVGVASSAFRQSGAGPHNPQDLEALQALMRRGQQDTMVLNNNLVSLLDQISRVADKLTADQSIHEKILASQADLSKIAERLDILSAHMAEQNKATEPKLQEILKQQNEALAQTLSQSLSQSFTQSISSTLNAATKQESQANQADQSEPRGKASAGKPIQEPSKSPQSASKPVAGAFLADPDPELPKDGEA